MAIKSGATDFVSRTSSELVFSFMGVSKDTKKVGLYAMYLPTREPVTGQMRGGFLKANNEVSYETVADGSIAGTVLLDQQDPSADISLTWKVDFNFLKENDFGFEKDVLNALLLGQAVDNGADRIGMLGTTGNSKIGKKATRCEVGQGWGDLTKKEWGYLILDGALDEDLNPVREKNTLIYSKNLITKCFIMETYTLSGSGKGECLLNTAVSANNLSSDEGDTNTTNADLMISADMHAREAFLYEGAVADKERTTDVLEEMAVDYIVTAEAEPTDFGTTGQRIALVSPTTGIVAIYVTDGSAWTQVVNKTFVQYARISAPAMTEDTIANAVDGVAFVTVAEPDATELTGVASRYDKDGAGAVTNFVCEVFAYDRDEELFIKYVPTDVCA